jgi:hypothetical protein
MAADRFVARSTEIERSKLGRFRSALFFDLDRFNEHRRVIIRPLRSPTVALRFALQQHVARVY